MDVAEKVAYKHPEEFEDDTKETLLDLKLTESTELLLFQWPINQLPDFDGKEMSLKHNRNGHFGSFVDSSGKSYEVVSCDSQAPNATVFLSSSSGSKIVGKVSRPVSLVHYVEPGEFEQHARVKLNNSSQKSSGSMLTHSAFRFSTPTQSRSTKSSKAGSNNRNLMSGESSKLVSGSFINRPRSDNQSLLDSGKGNSAITSESLEHSQGKSKKRRKNKD